MIVAADVIGGSVGMSPVVRLKPLHTFGRSRATGFGLLLSRMVPRHFFHEPAVANPPRRLPLDWWLVGGFIVLAVVEGVFNTAMYWRWLHVAVVIALAFTLLWRRTHPLAVLVLSLGSTSVLSLVGRLVQGEVADGPYAAALLLINVYAVFRWASGRHCAAALAMMAATFVLHLVIDYGGIAETIGGLIVFLFPAELGVIARMNTQRQEQAREDVRVAERERIARELHDSVAHHVSAIAVQAQAGRAVATSNPEAAKGALLAIEEAASRTLSDMRSMVGSLRGDDGADLAPQPGLRELAALAGEHGGLTVTVDTPDGPAPPTAVGTALFRIAQESVTNALRHAHGASLVSVEVVHDGDSYRLTVADDGRTNGSTGERVGYGLIGMAERAKHLGGSLDAGPSAGGWVVRAELPSKVVST